MFLRALRIQTLSNFEVSEPQNQNFIKQIHGRSSGCFVATQDSQGCSDRLLNLTQNPHYTEKKSKSYLTPEFISFNCKMFLFCL